MSSDDDDGSQGGATFGARRTAKGYIALRNGIVSVDWQNEPTWMRPKKQDGRMAKDKAGSFFNDGALRVKRWERRDPFARESRHSGWDRPRPDGGAIGVL